MNINTVVKILKGKCLNDFDSLIDPIKPEIKSAFEMGCGERYMTDHVVKLGIHITRSDNLSRIIDESKKSFF